MQITNYNYNLDSKPLEFSGIKKNKVLNNRSNNKISFGNNDEYYKKKIEKMKYIESQTYEIREIAYLGIIGGLLFESVKKQILKYGCFAVAIGAIIADVIKKSELSKEYDREHEN